MSNHIHKFITVYYLFSFTFDSTLTFHTAFSLGHTNRSQKCLDRPKKIPSNFENALRKIKDTTHNFGRNVYDNFNNGFQDLSNRNNIHENDVRQYERLVIMKKYPYLDIRELEMKYIPVSSKNTRNCDGFYLDRKMQRDSLGDPGGDLLNVEIINRGLTGFAIPPHSPKPMMRGECKSKTTVKPAEDPGSLVVIKNFSPNFQSLLEDINEYFNKKNVS